MTNISSRRAPAFSPALLVAALFFAAVSMTGCDRVRNELKADRDLNGEIQDYRDALAPRLPEGEEEGASAGAGIPGLQPYIASGSAQMKSMPLVSISVNQSVPLRDVLFELARQAEYDIELDPRIQGAVIFTAREKPFDEVIGKICTISGLRYKFKDDSLRVELDTPYSQSYQIDYISYVRKTSSKVKNDISVVTGDGADAGSGFDVSSESETDFWRDLDRGLTQMLAAEDNNILRTRTTPRITAAEANPNVAAVAPVTNADGSVQVQPPQAVLNVEALPVDDGMADPSTQPGGVTAASASMSINKQAGIISVFAPERTHKKVAEYLARVRRSVTAQVLIEAKVLEVTLSDRHSTGIDWRAINRNSPFALNYAGATALSPGGMLDSIGRLSGASFSDPGPTGTGVVLGYGDGDFQALIKAISAFGTVHALSSPRLTVLNNQSAVLNVAVNRVYFEVDVTATPDTSNAGGTPTVTITSEPKTIPEGVLINVMPSINLEDRTISMAVRPTVTKILPNPIADPAVTITAAQIADLEGFESTIPEVNVQEIDSILKVKSGQPIVMGGLLQDQATVGQNGVPILSELPLFGGLFRQHSDSVSKTELVIFLQATILDDPGDSIHNTDKDLYRKFSNDRRPFRL